MNCEVAKKALVAKVAIWLIGINVIEWFANSCTPEQLNLFKK